MIFVYHIEKTGLSSVEWSLHQLGIKVWNGHGLSDCNDDLKLDHKESINLLRNRSIDVYMSHFDYYFSNPSSIPIDEMCTVIREPVSRTISHISYLYANLDKPYMIDQIHISETIKKLADDVDNLKYWEKIFELCPYLSNHQVRRLCGREDYNLAEEKVSKMLIVEPFERLEQFFKRICEHFGVSGELIHINKNPIKLSPCEKVRDFILSKNGLDAKLWDYVSFSSKSR